MAKFTNKDLRLKDGQKVTWGSDLDANMWYDGSSDQLRLDVTLSGIEPTQDGHLTTKLYVDTEINALSSGIVLDHGVLTGLSDDDHTQYVLVDGTRAFTSTVGGVTPVSDTDLTTKGYVDGEVATLSGVLSDVALSGSHSDLLDLDADDHTQYILADGTRAFTGVVAGVTPTADNHLTTKAYVDAIAQGIDWQESVLDFFDPTSGLPTASGVGDRYISEVTANGWTADNIYEWNGTSWTEYPVDEGTAAWVEDEDIIYVYNGTSWVKMSSVMYHNNMSGLQGGTTNEYYHLTSDMFNSLTSNGGIENASDMHIHDDRYYTETEVDTLISGVNSSIITDHGSLLGLLDDDHTQYILVDGSRGFTATVSGIDPVAPSDLATKSYVDSLDDSILHGRQSIASDSSVVSVTFSDLGHTNYTVNATLENTSDSPPSIYAFLVTSKTSTGFTVTLMGDTDSANYVLNWSVVED